MDADMQQLGDDNNYLAYFKYQGDLVADGYLDAKKSAEVLLGIDEVLRYFIYQTDKGFAQLEFEIPILIRKGSWEALIPNDLTHIILDTIGLGVGTYTVSAVKKIADNDFKNVRTKDIFRLAIKSIKWVLKISTHLKSLNIKQFQEVTFKEQEEETLVGVENEKGEILYVPQIYLEQYKNCPEKLFSKLLKIVEEEREFELDFNPAEPIDKDDVPYPVIVTSKEKFIFIDEEDNNNILFPELAHGQYVELDGHVTRGNEKSNTIGFEYLKHILTCLPAVGVVKDYHGLLFSNCIIKGYVDRLNDQGFIIEKRPKIKFISLEELSSKGVQGNLFL